MTSFKHLNWDSDFFGYKVAQINEPLHGTALLELLKTLAEKNYRLVYIMADPQNEEFNNTILACGAKLVDQKIVLKGTAFLEKVTNYNSETNIEEYNKNYISDELLSLAFLSGEYSRFKTDINFKNSEFEKLYKTWLEQSVNNSIADKVFVSMHNGQTAGFVTVKKSETEGSIGLIAINNQFQGRNIGRSLIRKVQSYLLANNLSVLKIATQANNKNALAFYQKCGLNIYSKTNIYHYWL